MDKDFIYVSNYVKTARYPYHQVEKIVERDFGIFHTVHIHLKEKGSLDSYFWDFVDGRPVVNQPRMQDDLLAFTPLSDRISKDLKQRGMRFVGSTIIYSFLQACGFVDDHMVDCWCKAKKR